MKEKCKYKALRDLYLMDTLIAKKGDIIYIEDFSKVYNKERSVNGENMPYTIGSWFKTKNLERVEEGDKVNHPDHYTWLKEKCGIEVIDITRHMDFCLGNAIKYLLRAGYKSEEGYSKDKKEIEDLKKAIWYIKDKIKQIKEK